MLRAMNKLGAFLIVVAACKSGDEKGKSSGETAKAASGGGCEITATKPGELVSGKTPQLITPFTKLTFGMSPADAAKACPNFFEGEDAKKAGTFSVGEVIGKFGEDYAQARLEFVGNKLVAVSYSLPPEIADALTAAWGTPKTATGEPALAWTDDASTTRAILEPASYDKRRELTVSKYVPLAEFIDPNSKVITWQPSAVLGKKPPELAKQFPQYLDVDTPSAAVKAQTDEMMADMKKDMEAMGVNTKRDENMPEFELPASPLGDQTSTKVILHTNDDGTVRVYGVWFRTASISPAYGFPTQQAEIMKLLDEKWGPHKVVKETLGERKTWFDPKAGYRVSARVEKPEDLDLDYSRYMPLAQLFGAAGPVWGFEKAERPLIGATAAEIEATYGTQYEVKADATGRTITMTMPPTDYQGDSARTRILMFVEGSKVRQWNMNIPFEDYEPARAEYEALLDAKFGKPKKAPRDHFIYGKKPTVDVQYSPYTHDLNVQVSK